MQNIINVGGIECYEENGTAYLKLETVARGPGFTQEKNGVEYVRWETVDRNLSELGFPNKLGKDDFIPENVFYRLAKLLKQNGVEIGQNWLFEWLRNNGFLISRKGSDYNMPTQKAMEMGLFEIKETAIPHSDGHITVSLTPKVSGKGQKYFVNRFLQGVKQDV